jgi:flagellar basal-body rod protein FlgB
MSLFSQMKSITIMEKGLETATARRNIIANNIANVDVPNFKRSEVSFEAEMVRALDSEKRANESTPLKTTHPSHVSMPKVKDYQTVGPKVSTDYNSSMRNDGNNVDIEHEISAMNRNQMQYSIIIDRLGSNFRLMNQLIRLS